MNGFIPKIACNEEFIQHLLAPIGFGSLQRTKKLILI
jgi:hypothetical protein